MERNRELFYEIAATIEANPKRHNQESWAIETPCGTAYCIAGWAAALTLPKESLLFEKEGLQWDDAVITPSGRRQWIGSYGADVLGLDGDEADLLFDGSWAPEDMTVPQALRAIGDGAEIYSLTGWGDPDEDDWDE